MWAVIRRSSSAVVRQKTVEVLLHFCRQLPRVRDLWSIKGSIGCFDWTVFLILHLHGSWSSRHEIVLWRCATTVLQLASSVIIALEDGIDELLLSLLVTASLNFRKEFSCPGQSLMMCHHLVDIKTRGRLSLCWHTCDAGRRTVPSWNGFIRHSLHLASERFIAEVEWLGTWADYGLSLVSLLLLAFRFWRQTVMLIKYCFQGWLSFSHRLSGGESLKHRGRVDEFKIVDDWHLLRLALKFKSVFGLLLSSILSQSLNCETFFNGQRSVSMLQIVATHRTHVWILSRLDWALPQLRNFFQFFLL